MSTPGHPIGVRARHDRRAVHPGGVRVPTSSSAVSRRAVLLGGAAGLAAATVSSAAAASPGTATAATTSSTATPRPDVFTLGVASGDPVPDGVVLWTRLARDATKPNGGMTEQAVDVDWQVADDERFARVRASGRTRTGPQDGYAVHVEVRDLPAGGTFFYRFGALGRVSRAGTTRTAPPPNALAPLDIAVASCANYEHGYFTAYRHMARERPDLVLFLGDYFYEEAAGTYRAKSGNPRSYGAPEATTLEGYRHRYALHHADADLQAAHAVAPWVSVFDDHEVQNNWAGAHPESPQPDFLGRRAAAFRAWYENMPVRLPQRPRGSTIQCFRRLTWGATANLHMLDTRQYRDVQVSGAAASRQRTDPRRTITGGPQEQWLVDGFRRSRARWDVLGQQVFFSQLDLTPGPPRGFNGDAWDGYPVERDRIVASWRQARVRNAVVLSGDIHTHYVADIRADHEDPTSPVVGTELVSSSITSEGDGSANSAEVAGALARNPHLRYGIARRGYVTARFSADRLDAAVRVVDRVSTPGAPVRTAARFSVADRAPGLREA
ncbi:alkaline phosphatase D family protein [Actinomycetospora endophytica]|uniref:Alkaline phosphatase D family protein n=1 Tax=Actinomycetospora endophytica TaxID=2291215 RepID=A0ABS8P1Y7_9PSEU|nr:alkaline phosphatase D family protein [Actinomycetospora endophytica]MCD2192261.1 alkaline phosphatase D family protein [Actinomycetospora endophytica]